MFKSGELINVERGFYKIGPDFQKKAGYYKKHEFLYEGGLPENTEGEITSKEEIASKEEIISKEENAGQKSFFKTREEVGRILRTSSQEVEKMINELKIGDIGPKDFPFVAELRELTNTISAFCEKYKIG